jgi:hypothetical protein
MLLVQLLVKNCMFLLLCQPFKHLNCLRYTKHIAKLAEFVLLAICRNPVKFGG